MAQTLFVVSLVALVAVIAVPTAEAKVKKKTCARAIINDWYGDGQIDRQYELHCYKEAIRALPVDIKDYSRAPEDILRALAYRKKGEADPGNGGSGVLTPPKGDTGATTDPDYHFATTVADPPSTEPGGEDTIAANDGLDTSGPSSIPIPLLILGGLALLLLAAGGAGYVNRRRQARGADGSGP